MTDTTMRVQCAKCNKPVDWWEVSRREDVRGLEVHAGCHGDTDRCFVNDRDILEAGPGQDWSPGVAFKAAARAGVVPPS